MKIQALTSFKPIGKTCMLLSPQLKRTPELSLRRTADTISLSRLRRASSLPATREEALEWMDKLQDLTMTPQEGNLAYLPFIEYPGKSGWLKKEICQERVSFKKALDLLENGQEIKFKPLRWWGIFEVVSQGRAIKTCPYLTPKLIDQKEMKVANLGEFRDFVRDFESRKACDKLEELTCKPQEGKIAYLPRTKDKNLLSPNRQEREISFQQLIPALKDGKAVTLKPQRWTEWRKTHLDEMEHTDFYLTPQDVDKPEVKLTSLEDLINFTAAFKSTKPAPLPPMPEAETILNRLEAGSRQEPKEGKIIYQPFAEKNGKIARIDYREAKSRLEEKQPFYLQPMIWTGYTNIAHIGVRKDKLHLNFLGDNHIEEKMAPNHYAEGSKGKVVSLTVSPFKKKPARYPENYALAVQWTKINNHKDLEDFYRIERFS